VTPRIVPKTREYAAHLDEQERIRDAAHEFHEETAAALTKAQRKHGLPVTVHARDVYGPTSQLSFFRDLCEVRLAQRRAERAAQDPVKAPILQGRDPGDPLRSRLDLFQPNPTHGTLEDARQRLATVAEQRDVTSADPGVAAFLPAGSPSFVADRFARSAAAQARMAGVLEVRPLPEPGTLKIEVPRIDTGPSVAIQAAEGSTAVSETDMDAANPIPSSPIALIAGQNDVSRVTLERAKSLDAALAADLGAKVGALFDTQVTSGTGTYPQTLGLANVSGIIAVTYTDASATSQELTSKIWSAFQSLADPSTGFGISDPAEYITVLHPRTFAMLAAGVGSTAPSIQMPVLPGTVVQCGGLRTTLGGSTNETEAYVLVRSESFLCAGPVTFDVFEEIGSSTLNVRVQARQMMGAAVMRNPKSIARLSGTGFQPVTLRQPARRRT
jgi:hypothetical protein